MKKKYPELFKTNQIILDGVIYTVQYASKNNNTIFAVPAFWNGKGVPKSITTMSYTEALTKTQRLYIQPGTYSTHLIKVMRKSNKFLIGQVGNKLYFSRLNHGYTEFECEENLIRHRMRRKPRKTEIREVVEERPKLMVM